jgi:hypothetical protein
MPFEIRMNPNFKADVLKAAEEKLGVKILTEDEAHRKSQAAFGQKEW